MNLNDVLQFFVDLIFGNIASLISLIGGVFLTNVMSIITSVAQFNDFTSNVAVVEAWVLIRDVCNMFFILVLLLIAFATILQLENYSMKRWLPKLVIMAVLVNFSRMIVGLLIDFSQVIMLTFVDAFASGGGEWWEFFGVTSFLSALKFNEAEIVTNAQSNMAAFFIASIFIIISCLAMIGVLMVFVMRLIMLWILVVLSPLGFFLLAFPGGQKYASQYWGELKTYLMNGPVLAFFIWLAMTTLQRMDVEEGFNIITSNYNPVVGPEVMGTVNFLRFIIALSFILVGLKISVQIGGYGSSWGSGAVKRFAARGIAGAKGIGVLPVKGGKALGGFTVDKIHEKTGVDLNVGRVWSGIQSKRQEKRVERYSAGMDRAREVMATKGRLWGALAMSGTPASAWEQVTSMKGLKQRIKGGRRMREDKDEQVKKLDQIQFEKDFLEFNNETRNKKMDELKRRSDEIENKINSETDPGKRDRLAKGFSSEIKAIGKKLDYGNEELKKTRSDSELKEIKKEKDSKISKYQKGISANTPMYDFEARAAEQKMVNDKMSKIKDITDGGELGRILTEAINEKDKAMIKAITKKMAQNGDENEFLMDHAGRSDVLGLQKFVKKLQDEVKFGEQEAMNLGSEISNIAKGTNHWGATGAYKMVNGRWEETNEAEQTAFRGGETGKMHTQAMLRNFNRLAYGYHDKETGEFHLDKGGLEILKKFNEPGAIKMIEGGNLNESAALHIKPYLKGLKKQNIINEDLHNAIKKKIDSINTEQSSGEENLDNILNRIEQSRE